MYKIYSKPDCPKCVTAAALANSKGIDFIVLKLGTDYSREQLFAIAPGAREVPQISKTEDGTETLIGGLKEFQAHLAGT